MASSGDTGARSPGHVLIVEDDEGTARFLVRALERVGYTAAAVGDAIAAERHLDATDYDALLVDIGLPGASGFDLVREMKAAHPGLPMALMTANADLEVAVQALRSEVDDFLVKPIEPQALSDQVGRLVRRGRAAGAGNERVLAVGAHPDAVEIGVGGTLLRHGFMGDEVAVLALSHGADGDVGQERAAQAARAAELLGAELYLYDLEPERIAETEPTVGLIEGVVAEFAPTMVYTHSANDQRKDHRNTHQATLSATRRVRAVYCYEGPSATVDFRPGRFVTVDPFIEAKIEAIGAFGTQITARRYVDPEMVRATGRYWGRFGDSRYCEPFEVVREGVRQPSTVAAGEAGATT